MGRIFGIWLVAGFVVAIAAAVPGEALGKQKKAAAAAPTAGKTLNACGCYADGSGSCYCGRKGKCGCPGECEPRGCEEKRAKEIQKEIAAETRKAAEAEKKQRKAEASGDSQKGDSGKPRKKAASVKSD